MPKASANGLELEYEAFGPADGPVVIHIMGFASQLTRWADEYFHGLAERGYRAIRFDNRDIGLSQKLPELGVPNVAELMGRAMAGQPVEAPYTLDDMADDVAGLMDALEIETAHVQGESMGGRIAQLTALRHPGRLRSLVSVMSTSGRPDLPQADPEARAVLFTVPKDPSDAEEVIAIGTNARKVLAGPGFDPGDAFHRAAAEAAWQRNYYLEGPARHMAAILATGGRQDELKTIDAPTLVVHGRDDRLLPLAHGEDVAALVPGAGLHVVDGMGHAVEPALAPLLVEVIGDFYDRVEGRS